MALPESVTKITVEGNIVDMDTGAGGQGYVEFTAPIAIVDRANNLVLAPHVFRADLDADGFFTVDLIATDDEDLSVTGWEYVVDVKTDLMMRTFKAAVPVATVGVLAFADMLDPA